MLLQKKTPWKKKIMDKKKPGQKLIGLGIIFAFLILISGKANALEQSYNIIVADNGNAAVIAEITGMGLARISLPDDVSDVKVKGALYKLGNGSIDISIGSTKKALALYKTSLLTSKTKGVWKFEISLPENTSRAIIALPKNAIILKTEPPGFIEKKNYTKIIFENKRKIMAEYRFPDPGLIESNNNGSQKNSQNKILYWLIISALVALAFYIKTRLNKKKSNKENLIRTLSKNEKTVVNALMENKSGIKRSILERKTKMAKSSLANTLNMLERKKIIEIDKTSASHYIKFTRWFDEL